MTHREFLDKNYKAISDLQSLYIHNSFDNQFDENMNSEEASDKNESLRESVEYAISAIRHNLVTIYKDLLDRRYHLFDQSLTTFLDHDMYLTDTIYLRRQNATLCCRKDGEFYYFFKIKDRSSFDYIQTETHDDFPGGRIPYKAYEYPEQALLYKGLEFDHTLDKEIDDEYGIGHYDWEIETSVY